MWNTKRLCICLLACSLWLAAGSTLQAETMYQISESELTALDTNLDELEKSNANKQDLLTEQRKQLETAQTELAESKKTNAETRKLLESANQSLKELEDEAKGKIEVKTRQRNLWIAISGGLMYALAKK
nr:MAG TPA: SECRETED 45 KDA PROTEIN CYCLE, PEPTIDOGLYCAN, CHAP, CELL [Caudoviricetes sp.]